MYLMITNQMVVMMITLVKLMMLEVRMSVPEITNRGNHGLGPKPISKTMVMLLVLNLKSQW